MSRTVLIILTLAIACQAWSLPFYPVQRAPLRRMRYTRYAPPPPQLPQKPHRIPIPVHEPEEYQRPKRGHEFYDDHDHDHSSTRGVTGPVHTFVKTDKNANYKWGVRHHVGNKYAS